ncbi:IS1380 family transposase [Acrocarpospora corrugata]|uniref:IS1380 family transposase n=1 Tax=Acrocarpospora corrugata TaxID=35763 RepID=A0A5M3WAA9_9ACTN|nr:IS1380 family transposase [Acrocarpospora corrugata]GES05814.1 IS1380 family transposase [Acrocarpospora corrugata]
MHSIARRPKIVASAGGKGLVCQAGGLLLVQTLRVTGLDQGMSQALQRWRPPRAVHDPGKIVTDLAVALALGGDCLADISILRDSPELFGPIASDPTVSRLVKTLADAGPKALRAIRAARAAARSRAWRLAGDRAPGSGGALIPVDLDATIVLAHSEKEQAAPTWKHTFGYHPMTAFIDHGAGGTGEAAALLLRAGNAGSNTAEDHITAGRIALTQIPARLHKQVMIRTDAGGGTHAFLDWVTRRRLKYSIGFTLTEDIQAAILALPKDMWEIAYDADRQPRPGAWVAELTGMLDLSSWPKGMRVIARRERPHPGAQLRFTDIDGHRFTCFVTGTRPGGGRGQLADLELRHRRRARCEDRIRTAKDTGLRNLPLHHFARNQIWCEIVALACDLLAWMQLLALEGSPARLYEPKRLRLRLFAVAARLTRGGRRLRLRIAARWPWAQQIITAIARLQALPAPT